MKLSGLYKGKTIAEAMEIYAPRSENNTDAYLQFIKQKSGVDLSKKLADLTPAEYEAFMGAIREYESSAGRGHEKGKGTVIKHSGNDGQAAPAPDLSTLRPEPRPRMGDQEGPAAVDGEPKPGDQPAEPEPPQEQKKSEAPADPRTHSLVEMASAPIDNPGRSALLKPVEKLTQAEMMDMINHAQGDYRGHRAGDPLKYHTYEKVQDWHVAMYGDGPQQHDGGKPVEPKPIRPIPEQPSPHTTPDGGDLWLATARIGQQVAEAAGTDGYSNAVKGLQRGLNILNQANPLPARSPAYGPYTKLGPVTEDGQYGPQTDFALKYATARQGPAKVQDGLALGRFNTFARNAQTSGNADGLEAATHGAFGPLFRSGVDTGSPKVEGGVLQETLNVLGPRHHDDWEALKVDNWVGPKTTAAFGRVLQNEDADRLTTAFGRGLGLL
ncbi:hypothetical protein MTBUT4_80091 [Magnetospirillum sp. UT-4]|nr:hypothetical protein MTBUT4_80091 [Magnetospirillum sp. UT-4]